jgi:hypothetical protein
VADPWEEYQDAPWSQYAETKPASEGTRVAEELVLGKPKEKTFGERAGAVGTAAGLTGAASVAIPRVLQAIPATKPLGMALSTVSPWLRGISGTLSGGASETAGQVAEMVGAPPALSEGARFATAPAQSAIERGSAFVGGKAGRLLRQIGKASEVDNQSQATKSAIRQLAGKEENAPETISKTLGMAGGTKLGQISDIERMAQDRKNRAAGLMTQAEQRTQQAQSQAAGLNRVVGSPRPATDIGKELRQKIVQNKESEISQRSQNYKEDMAARDSVVAEKESAGQFVINLPEYKEMLDGLRNKLLIGATAQKQPAAQVTEKGVVSAYQNLYDALRMQRKQVGVTETGEPIFKSFPPSFQAIDDVRRKMGDVAFGKEVEGYQGISSNIAKDFYSKLSDIQRKFAGDAQDVLQSRYEEASTLLERFKGKGGRRATAIDKYNDQEFATDPSKLPSTYFSTKTGVQDLVAMTGDKALVQKAGREFASSQINGMTSEQVSNWIRKSEWLDELPAVKSDIQRYQIALNKAEQVAKKGKETVSGLRERIGKESKAASESIEKIRKEVEAIQGDPRPGQRMQELILGTKAPEDLRLVGQYIAADPVASKAFPDAVRQIIASKVSPSNMRDTWRLSVRPLLEGSNIVPAATLDAIEQDVVRVSQTLDPAQRITWLQDTIGKVLALGAQRGVSVVGQQF